MRELYSEFEVRVINTFSSRPIGVINKLMSSMLSHIFKAYCGKGRVDKTSNVTNVFSKVYFRCCTNRTVLTEREAFSVRDKQLDCITKRSVHNKFLSKHNRHGTCVL